MKGLYNVANSSTDVVMYVALRPWCLVSRHVQHDHNNAQQTAEQRLTNAALISI